MVQSLEPRCKTLQKIQFLDTPSQTPLWRTQKKCFQIENQKHISLIELNWNMSGKSWQRMGFLKEKEVAPRKRQRNDTRDHPRPTSWRRTNCLDSATRTRCHTRSYVMHFRDFLLTLIWCNLSSWRVLFRLSCILYSWMISQNVNLNFGHLYKCQVYSQFFGNGCIEWEQWRFLCFKLYGCGKQLFSTWAAVYCT